MKAAYYGYRLVDLDDSLKMLLKRLELQQARDVKVTLHLARSIRRATLRPPPPPPLSPPKLRASWSKISASFRKRKRRRSKILALSQGKKKKKKRQVQQKKGDTDVLSLSLSEF